MYDLHSRSLTSLWIHNNAAVSSGSFLHWEVEGQPLGRGLICDNPCCGWLDVARVRSSRAGGLSLPREEWLPRTCTSKSVFSRLFMQSHSLWLEARWLEQADTGNREEAEIEPGTFMAFLYVSSWCLDFLRGVAFSPLWLGWNSNRLYPNMTFRISVLNLRAPFFSAMICCPSPWA